MRAARIALWTLLLPFGAAWGHDFGLTETRLSLGGDGTFEVEMTCDLDALALGVSAAADSAELAARLAALPPDQLAARIDGLERTLERRVRVRFDGRPAPFTVAFPEVDAEARRPASGSSLLGTTVRFAGEIPPGADHVTFFASRAFPPVRLTVLDAHGRTLFSGPLQRGEESPEITVAGRLAPPGALDVAGRYFSFGFLHIVPRGADHVLFVVGLFLLGAGWRPLLWQVSAFTAAHTATLALSAFGVVALPPSIVEPAIALSIAWVALENAITRELKPWRPALVFGFGLLHGLGFAGVLGELGLPAGERVTALLAFNLGVEAGQLVVLAAAFAVTAPWRRRRWYRSRLAVPASLAIAALGLLWAVRRLAG